MKEEESEYPGIIYCDQRKYSIGETIRELAKVVEKRRKKDLENKIWYL